MASVTFKRGTKAEIESTQIQDGQLLMETDQLNNNKIYLDLPNGTRVPVGGSGAWVGTKEEFELAVEEGKIADGTQVIITDDYESGITASMTLYSNAQSGLVATNVQSAIDELNSNLNEVISDEFTESNYTVNYCYVGNICTVKVYRNQIPTSDVTVQLTQKLPKKPKYNLRTQNYRGTDSFLQIGTDGKIYIEHIKSDNVYFNITITFLCV